MVSNITDDSLQVLRCIMAIVWLVHREPGCSRVTDGRLSDIKLISELEILLCKLRQLIADIINVGA